MSSITLTITDTPLGVVIRADGYNPAPSTSGAQRCAEMLVRFGESLFINGQQVLLGGELDPVKRGATQ